MKKSLSLLFELSAPKTFKTCLPFIIVFVCTLTANAQFFDDLTNPKITVTLQHPPIVGFKINKVAFGQANGNCADQIVDAIQSDFVANQVEVIDREHLNSMMAEHNFTMSGYVDKSTAVAMGKFLGPTTLIFVKVNQCNTVQDHVYANETQYDSKTKTNYNVVAYFSRTRTNLNASVEAIDLTTGRIIAKEPINYNPEKANKSYQGYPEYPADVDVQQIAFAYMVRFVHVMFLPWSEQKEVVFYNDNKGGLKLAFQALKAGDLDQTFDLSQKNVDACKSIPKVSEKLMAHAYYNLGMSYFMRGDYDNALVNFRETAKRRPGDIVTEAIANCQKAIELAAAMKRIDQEAAFADEKKQAENNKVAQNEASNTLTNADIIKLTKLKLSEAIIIQKIKLSKCKFNTSADALASLSQSGVSEKVVMAMMEKSQ